MLFIGHFCASVAKLSDQKIIQPAEPKTLCYLAQPITYSLSTAYNFEYITLNRFIASISYSFLVPYADKSQLLDPSTPPRSKNWIYVIRSKHVCYHGFFFFFWPHFLTCKILVPRPGIGLQAPTMNALSPNHWMTREFPCDGILNRWMYGGLIFGG